MQTLGIICAATIAGAALAGELIAVPSGQEVRFEERIDPGPWPAPQEAVHFRFIAPAISRDGGTVSLEMAEGDMLALCEGFALPILTGEPALPSRIIISLSDRLVPYGQADPEATQYFEAYRPEGTSCIAEMF